MVVASESFAALARAEALAQGLLGARIAVVPHPIGGTRAHELRRRADAAVDEIISLFTER